MYIYMYVYVHVYVCVCMYIKSKLGITHFAHNYMETSHVASKPNRLYLDLIYIVPIQFP